MTNKSIRDYINLIENLQQVPEGSTTMWEVSFDYGPHMSKTVKVKAGSKQEAKAKVEKAAEKSYTRGIMINWVKPVEQGVAEGSLNEFAPDGFNGGDDETPGSWEDFIKAFDPEIRKMGFGMDKRSSHDARIYAHPKAEKGVMVRQHPEKDNVYFKLFHFFNNGEDKAGLADLSQNGAASVLVKVEDFLNGEQGVAEEQLEETTPEALAKIDELTRR